jgi:hypothetical protein
MRYVITCVITCRLWYQYNFKYYGVYRPNIVRGYHLCYNTQPMINLHDPGTNGMQTIHDIPVITLSEMMVCTKVGDLFDKTFT